MNKEQLQRFVNELNDDEQTWVWAYTKHDLDYDRKYEDLPPLTEEQWERFCHWMNKYVDLSQDYGDALHYALGGN